MLEVRRAALHAEHPDIERSLLELGRLVSEQNRFEEAGPLLREAVELREARLPAGHARIKEAREALERTE